MKWDSRQLSLDVLRLTDRFEFAGKEYVRLENRLHTAWTNWERFNFYENTACCKWYEAGQGRWDMFFDSEEERDRYLQILKDVLWTDKHWNCYMYYPIGIYFDENDPSYYNFWNFIFEFENHEHRNTEKTRGTLWICKWVYFKKADRESERNKPKSWPWALRNGIWENYESR